MRVIAEPVPFEELACNAFGAVVRYAGKDSEDVQALARALDQLIGVGGIERNPKLAALRFAVRRRTRLPAQSQSL